MKNLPRLFIHIGGSKCGSSTIQQLLLVNRKFLREQGYLLLDRNGQPGALSKQVDVQHVPYFQAMLPLDQSQIEAFGHHMRNIHSYMQKHHFKAVIFSAENLCTPEGYEKLFADLEELFDIKVIMYIRNQQPFFISAWKQWGFKTGADFSTWFSQAIGHLADWNTYLLPWEEVLGQERISLRLFETIRLRGQSLPFDFAHEIGLSDPQLLTGLDVRANPSINDKTLHVLEQVTNIYEDRHDNKLENMLFRHAKEAAFSRDTFTSLYTPEALEQVYEAYYESNTALFQRYYPDEKTEDIFPKVSIPYKTFTSEEITNHAFELLWTTMLSLHQQVEQLDRKVKANTHAIKSNDLKDDVNLLRRFLRGLTVNEAGGSSQQHRLAIAQQPSASQQMQTSPQIPHPLKDDECLCFIHIAKTGGTTFRTVLESMFKPEDIHFAYSKNKLSPDLTDGYQLLCGHFIFDKSEQLGDNAVFVTMLRHPVMRARSIYQHIVQDKDHKHHEQVKTLSLEQFLESSPDIRLVMSNWQTRVLSGHVDPYITPDVDLAKRRLREKFIFFGLTERYEESLQLLAYTLQWPPITDYKRQNVTRDRKDIPKKLISRIEELNELDLELYEFATKLFEERYAQIQGGTENSYSTARRREEQSIDQLFDKYENMIVTNIQKHRLGDS